MRILGITVVIQLPTCLLASTAFLTVPGPDERRSAAASPA